MAKKKILIFIDWFLPGYKAGGPIRSVANMVQALKDDFEFSIITSDHDLDNIPYENIPFDRWIENYPARVWYISKRNLSIKTIIKLIKESNNKIAYFNSFFSVYFTIIPLILLKILKPETKIILAPRGMLGDGALNIKKKKKNLFIYIARLLRIYNQIIWHASTPVEAEEIKKIFGRNANIRIAQNISLVLKPELDNEGTLEDKRKIKNKGDAKFFFLSRIALKKNLLYAIVLFNHINGNGEIVFDIFGPVEDRDYWKQCETAMDCLKSNVKINYKGALPNSEISAVLKDYHFLLLPTLNENYGHVIVESLMNGCPVIISDNTPWIKLEEKKVGWTISLSDKQKFKDVINYCISITQNEFDCWSDNAIIYAKEKVFNYQIINDNKELFAD